MWWRSFRVPVAMEAAQTGVTDGNAAHASGLVPRSRTAASAGARPAATAGGSIDGLGPSIPARTRPRATSAQDAQAGVLLALAAATAGEQPREERGRDEGERRQEDGGQGDERGGALGVDGQRGARLCVESARGPGPEGAGGGVRERRARDPDEDARPPGAQVVVEGPAPQHAAQADGEAR